MENKKNVNGNYYILLTAFCFILATSCKRKCQDERADNYKDDRKSTCDYSYADNWYKNIIMDSVVINGVKVELENESWNYIEAYQNEETHVFDEGALNNYSSEFNTKIYIPDTLKSISYTFGIPVASDYIVNVRNELANYYISYRDGGSISRYKRSHEIFDFIEEKEINGVKYRFYNIEKNDFISEGYYITQNNYQRTYILLVVNYDIFQVYYEFSIKSKN